MREVIFDVYVRRLIWNELHKFPLVETGGVLLGYVTDEGVYVKETVYGGEQGIREPGMFQYDISYVEQQSNKVASGYKPPLVLVGIWHKHNHTLEPAFSRADYEMHNKLLKQCEEGVSCLFQRREDGRYQLQILDSQKKIYKSSYLW